MTSKAFEFAGEIIQPGERRTVEIPITRLYTHTPVAIPVHVIHGKKPGPRLFVSAAIHGDEINGVETIRRLLKHSALQRIRGTLLAIPIVNVHGFINLSRYLPDRRDLNRSFPGSLTGSLASRLANLFIKEIVEHCTHGIDLHTGALHRDNLPQIRANLDDEETTRLAKAFSVPVLLNSNLRDGSLRQAAADLGIPMLLFEGGEALRFDEIAIRSAERGILNVMRLLEMIPPSKSKHRKIIDPIVARSSSWVRAAGSGILRTSVALGTHIKKNDPLCVIADPFGEMQTMILSPVEGIVIGKLNLPLVNEGDALFHIARFGKVHEAAERVEEFNELLQPVFPLA